VLDDVQNLLLRLKDGVIVSPVDEELDVVLKLGDTASLTHCLEALNVFHVLCHISC